MSDRHQQKPYPIRMPDELRERLEVAAAGGNRSLHAEIMARLDSSFKSVDVNDAAGMLLDTQRLQEMVDALRKIISAQEVNLIVLSTYLVDVINALPQKLRNEDRIQAAAKFVLGLDEVSNGNGQQSMLQLDTPRTVETIKAVVRGKKVDTGIVSSRPRAEPKKR